MGENHLMLNKFAKSISYIGVNVFIPRIPDLKKVRINEKCIDQMVDAYNSIVNRDNVDKKNNLLNAFDSSSNEENELYQVDLPDDLQ